MCGQFAHSLVHPSIYSFMHILGTLSALTAQDSEGHGGGTADMNLMIPGSQNTDAQVGAP